MAERVSRIYQDIDLEFTLNPNTEDISKKYDVNAVKQSLNNLLLIKKGDYPFDPNFGSNINALLFEPMEDFTTNIFEKEITQTIQNHEPRVNLISVDVIPNEITNAYEIEISFYVIGVREPQTYAATLRRDR